MQTVSNIQIPVRYIHPYYNILLIQFLIDYQQIWGLWLENLDSVGGWKFPLFDLLIENQINGYIHFSS